MPTNAERFFEEQKEASRYKVDLLRKYAVPFFYKLGSAYRQVWIVDGFAGPGSYSAGSEKAPVIGSPVATAQVADKVSQEHRSQLRVINVEKNADLFERLRRNTTPFGSRVINLQGSFASKLPDILQIVGDDPVLFFVDPFGMSGADLALVDRILDRRARTVTELLIHFSFKGFQRMAGNLNTIARSEPRQRAAQTHVENLDRMLSDRRWRWIWNDGSLSAGEKCEAVSELFQDSLRDRGIEFVHAIGMRDEYYGPTRYQLIFATRSSHGVYLMSDSVARYEEDLFNAAQESQQTTLEPQIRQTEGDARRFALKSEIHRFGLTLRRADPAQIMRQLAPKNFGRFTEADYMRSLRELVQEGGIARDGSRGIAKGEKLRFVPLAQASLFSTGAETGDPHADGRSGDASPPGSPRSVAS